MHYFHECSEASGRNADKVVLYEDAAKKQLQEFISALRGCEQMAQACSSLGVILNGVKSRQLHNLLTPGMVVSINISLYYFGDSVFDVFNAVNCRKRSS